MEKRIGEHIDRYRILRMLDSGGFGTVYLAQQGREKRQVALKLMPPLGQEGLNSFLTEARMMRLKHPHIIQILDFGLAKQQPFLVMEYAPHGTLKQRHPKGTRVPLSLVLSYAQQIASALQYAHDERIIHRDVKPENMLLNVQDQVLLSDFGIASVIDHSAQVSQQSIIGTLPYMAPEQTRGYASTASDQYSLAIVVYEWLCGVRPFQGTGMEVVIQHRLDPPPLRHIRPDLSPDIEQVVLTALAKKPEQRFASVRAFATASQAASPENSEQEGKQQGSFDDRHMFPGPTEQKVSAPSLPPEPSVSHVEQMQKAKEAQKPPSVLSAQPVARLQEASRLFDRLLYKRGRVLAITLLVLFVLGSSSLWAVQQVRSNATRANAIQANATRFATLADITATAGVEREAYNRAVVEKGIQFGFDPQHSRFNPYERLLSAANVSQLTTAWTTSTGSNIDSSPAIADGVVYVGSWDGRLYAFPADGCRQSTCTPLWIASTGDDIRSSPTIANGIVYIGSRDHKLYAFSANGCSGQLSCAPLWAASTGDFVDSSPAVANGIVYIGSDKLYAFQRKV